MTAFLNWTLSASAAIVSLLLLSTSVQADGLLYQLPADGTSAQFAMKLEGKAGSETITMNGQLLMSSVGRAEHDGQPSRWIEIKAAMKHEGREQVILSKLHVLEKHLKQGGAPFENLIKAYVKRDNGRVRELTGPDDRAAGPLPAFLSAPPVNAQELPSAIVKSVLGEVKCKGIRGETTIKQGENTINMTIESRLHERAPFGVVASTIKFVIMRNSGQTEEGTIEVKLAKVGQDAKSELPDAN